MKTILATVADDRSGRKEGRYSETQDYVLKLFQENPWFGITEFSFWKWENITQTDFYKENKRMLDQIDPAMNGRCYKPFVIKEALNIIQEGDFVIYNDVSPNLWTNIFPNKEIHDLSIIRNLCIHNNGILTANVDNPQHTHHHYTLERCMNKMNMEEYRHHHQHASGMIVLQKNQKTIDFVQEWLKWNLDPECASLGSINEPLPPEKCICEYWHEEYQKYGKLGHRHDQSISGLLLNKMGNKLIKNHDYNFLNYCRKDLPYAFVNTL